MELELLMCIVRRLERAVVVRLTYVLHGYIYDPWFHALHSHQSERFKEKQSLWSMFCVGGIGGEGFICVYVHLSLYAFEC